MRIVSLTSDCGKKSVDSALKSSFALALYTATKVRNGRYAKFGSLSGFHTSLMDNRLHQI
ncbi:hypothetical protein D0C16_11280 [Cellvibrio sp. KY-GH-1]|nr:hypothetical protein D0C16_11280 [Cellvibrio sp. KY-GH-1]